MTVKGVGKIVFAAFCGTLIEILGLLFVPSYQAFILCVHLLEVPLMIWFVQEKTNRRILPMVLSGYFFTMLISGFLEILWNYFGEKGNYLFNLVFSSGAVFVGGALWKRYAQMKKGIFSVEIIHRAQRVMVQGFYDSGNRLIDPYTGKGVHIVSESLIKRLKLYEETAVFVPYQALGNENGMLEVYYVDELIVEGEKGRKNIQKCPVGVTKDNLFEGKKYEMIINEEVF